MTYEDFLRPTALMILHHSAVIDNNSAKNFNFDTSVSNLDKKTEVTITKKYSHKDDEVLDDNDKNKETSSITCNSKISNDDNLCQPDYIVSNNDIDRKLNAGEKNDESDIMLHNYSCNIDYSRRKQTLSPVKEISEDESISTHSSIKTVKEVDYDDAILKETEEKLMNVSFDSSSNKNPDRESHLNLVDEVHNCNQSVKSDSFCCVCKSMTMEEYKVRISALRKAEFILKEKQVALDAREHEAAKREKRIAEMEKEAKNHLIRAQIYLRHSRAKADGNCARRPASDLDTTVSADFGDDSVLITTAAPDPNLLQNPFLAMRGMDGYNFNFDVDFSKKSHTLDNPKSRRKRGSIFTLVKDWEYNEEKLKNLPNIKPKEQLSEQKREDSNQKKKNVRIKDEKPEVAQEKKKQLKGRPKNILSSIQANCYQIKPKSHTKKFEPSSKTSLTKDIKTNTLIKSKKNIFSSCDKENLNIDTSEKSKNKVSMNIKTRLAKKNQTRSQNSQISSRVLRSQDKKIHYF